jgi:putative NIF3 family GTP cyclohydrolase 1 type 2
VVDLCLTGELRHHDVMARVHNGTSVILSDHTHSERGYLPLLANRLQTALGGAIEALVSQSDDDPLSVV